MGRFLDELRRRNVFRVAIAYIVIAWLLLQVGDTLAPALHLPDWSTSLLAFFLILGFPLALFFAWAYELTPEGIKREREVSRDTSITRATGRKLDFAIIALLSIALAWFAWDKFASDAPPADDDSAVVASQDSVERSIAVLPFVNLSADAEQEYFADGLSEELLNLLAKIPQLRVTSRSSAFYYKGKDIRIADVGKELGVSHVLEGSVRKSGNQVRVTAQLISVADDAHLWSETWDREFSNVFAIQDDIASQVSNALRIQLVDELPHAYVTDPEAYKLYLQALQLSHQLSQASMEAAEAKLQDVLAIDPDYAPALALLGDTLIFLGQWEFRPMAESFERARELGRLAVETDPGFSGGYLLLGRVATVFDNDIDAARRYFKDALVMDPNNMAAVMSMAFNEAKLGRTEPLIKAARQGVQLDPHSAAAWWALGHAAKFNGNAEESINAFKKMAEIDPEGVARHAALAEAYFVAGDYEQALAEFEAEPLDGFRYFGRAIVYHRLGDREASDAALATLIEIDNNQWAAQIAWAHAVRGETEEALKWLDIGLQRNDQGIGVSAVNPFLENLRGDPRFDEFLRRLRSGRR